MTYDLTVKKNFLNRRKNTQAIKGMINEFDYIKMGTSVFKTM